MAYYSNVAASPQSALNNCTSHNGEEIDSFCEDCELPICEMCVKSDHSGHQWYRMAKMARKRRQDAPTKGKEIRDKVIPKLTENLLNIKEVIKHNEECKHQKTEMILQRKDNIVSEVNRLTSILIHICDMNEAKAKSVLIKYQNGIIEKIEHMEKMVYFLENEIGTVSNYVFLEMDKSLRQELEHLKPIEPWGLADMTQFIEGTGSLEEYTESMLGFITEENIKGSAEVTDLVTYPDSLGNEIILSIWPLARDKAWIHSAGSTQNFMISLTSDEITNVDFGCCYLEFIVLDNGDYVFGDVEGKSIKKLSVDGVVSEIVNTSPLSPQGICLTLDKQSLLVCLLDQLSFSVDKNSKRVVQHMSLNGEVIQTYQHRIKKSKLFRRSKIKKIFTKPEHVKQNHNSDICVANVTSNITSELCVLGIDGQYKFLYKGQKLGHPFYAGGICCDSESHIIVTDNYNHATHILQADGQFLRYLFTKEDDIMNFPSCLALHENTLWIGSMTGQIKVSNYKDNPSSENYVACYQLTT